MFEDYIKKKLDVNTIGQEVLDAKRSFYFALSSLLR